MVVTGIDRPAQRTAIVRRQAAARLEPTNLPIQGTRSVHGDDLPVMAKARGAVVIDVDGNQYVDHPHAAGEGRVTPKNVSSSSDTVWHLCAAPPAEQLDAAIESAREVMQELSHRG